MLIIITNYNEFNDVIDDFSEDGLLAKTIKGFKQRSAQQMMAKAVIDAIEKKHQLVVEAGTGTGKTFAYLVPALRCGKKVIISTGSKNLQDQLFNKDLPLITNTLSYSGKIALLKGRNNYLCLERLANQQADGSDLVMSLRHDLNKVKQWSLKTTDGDISQCAAIKEGNVIWPSVTSSRDNCLGSDCKYYESCYVVKARRRALHADIIVVNHHLFLADIVVKDNGFGELIPNADVIIFDEAHQIPDIASQYFGLHLSTRQLIDLAKEINTCYRIEIKDMSQLEKCAHKLEKSAKGIRQVFAEYGSKGNLHDLIRHTTIKTHIKLVFDALTFCYDVLQLAVGRSKILDNCLERTINYNRLFERLMNTEEAGYSYIYQCTAKSVVWSLIPLSVSERFKALFTMRGGSWIFTSATLSINNKLDYFTKRLGLRTAKPLLLTSPFDFQNQTLLCVPRYMPAINEKDSVSKLAAILLPIIECNEGRCFCLCTSYTMMNGLACEFKKRTSLSILVQGETSKVTLLNEFIEKGNAVLVATNSFWEGIDVRGDALSCVIIDKLPFSPPNEPLIKARMADCAKKGGDPFIDIQIPEAVIALKQGVGRLIRDHNDKGVIIICDNRLVTKSYGAIFLNSLPPSPRTRDINQAMQFLKSNKNAL